MAQLIRHKRSAVAGKVPTAAQLELGELAINTAGGCIFLKKSDGTVVKVCGIDTDSHTGVLYTGDTDPTTYATVNEGDLWHNNAEDTLYAWDGTQWVKAGASFDWQSGAGDPIATNPINVNSVGQPLVDGDQYWDTTANKLWGWDAPNNTWVSMGGSITVADVAPNNPSEGDVWYDSATDYRAFVWVDDSGNGSWVDLSPGVGNKIFIQDAEPAGPSTGDGWIDTDGSGTLVVWNGDAWVEILAGVGTVDGDSIVDGSITTAKLADDAVTNAKIANNAVTLGTQTTGNYVATVTAGSQITVTGSGSETAAVTVAHADTSTLTGWQGTADNGEFVDRIQVDSNGHVTGVVWAEPSGGGGFSGLTKADHSSTLGRNGNYTLTAGTWYIKNTNTADAGTAARRLTIPTTNVAWGFGQSASSDDSQGTGMISFTILPGGGNQTLDRYHTRDPWCILVVTGNTTITTNSNNNQSWSVYKWA